VSDDIFLGILLDGGVEPKLADEICWIHKLSLGVLHHGEESLQAGHLATGLVQLRVLKLIGTLANQGSAILNYGSGRPNN
jgi:hypothetical protein